MIQTFDTDAILYKLLNGSTSVKSLISGGIYVRKRPDGSELQDIVVNTIALSQEYEPQIGTSNINIHVSDLTVTAAGKQQKMPNIEKMKTISANVLELVRSTKIAGLAMVVENQTTIQEPEINQHYVNIRINWFIH